MATQISNAQIEIALREAGFTGPSKWGEWNKELPDGSCIRYTVDGRKRSIHVNTWSAHYRAWLDDGRECGYYEALVALNHMAKES